MVDWLIMRPRPRLLSLFVCCGVLGGNAGEVVLPTDGGRNNFGSHFGLLFVKGVYVYGQLLTEISETIKMVVSKAYFRKNALRSYL